jgi:hypothetical protein
MARARPSNIQHGASSSPIMSAAVMRKAGAPQDLGAAETFDARAKDAVDRYWRRRPLVWMPCWHSPAARLSRRA